MIDNTTSSQRMESEQLFLGTWVDTCEYGPEMRYVVTLQDERFIVSAVDTRDLEDEEGEVDDIRWDDKRLYFTVYWESSDVFAECQFFLISPNQIAFTYTNTEKLTLVRKQMIDKTPLPLLILGTWRDDREYGSFTEYTITLEDNVVGISVVCTDDNEKGEIYSTHWDGKTLSAAIYWQSTGRFMKCQFAVISPDQILYTYTYTAQCILIREQQKQA